jgi:hypothetical protein
MGLWQTGYFEFHEETGLSGSFTHEPVRYACGTCGNVFDSQDALFEHRFQFHPFKRPVLFLNGVEVSSPNHLVVRQITLAAIEFGSVTTCYLNSKVITKSSLKKTLSEKKHGVCTVLLEHDGIDSEYQIEFDVSLDDELYNVEQLFFDVVGGVSLDLKLVDLFIDMSAKYKSATRYVDGLSSYLYGVLAKDGRGGTHLARADAITKFNQALDILSKFDRYLAKAIIGVVNFNQNIFELTDSLAGAPKLHFSSIIFNGFVTGNNKEKSGFNQSTSKPSKNIPLDYATEKIFEWSLMPLNELANHLDDVENFLKSADVDNYDKFKVQMLKAEMLVASGAYDEAIRIAGGYRNDAVFGSWAQRIIGAKE